MITAKRRDSALIHITEGGIRDINVIYSETCALLGYYAASSGNCLLTFRDNITFQIFLFFFGFLKPKDGNR